jgi:FolB domain-containing protein
MTRSRDTIHIDELLLTLPLATDDTNGKGEHSQAILLSLIIAHDISRTARSDDLTYSINYAAVYKTLVETLPATRYASLEALVDYVFQTLFRSHPEVDEASVVVTLRDTLPRFAIETTCRRDQTSTGPYRFTIGGLVFPTIVGVNPRERTEKQPVVFDITIDRLRQHSTLQEQFPFVNLSTSIRQVCTSVSLPSGRVANVPMDSIDIRYLDLPHRRGTRVGRRMSRSRAYKTPRRQGDDQALETKCLGPRGLCSNPNNPTTSRLSRRFFSVWVPGAFITSTHVHVSKGRRGEQWLIDVATFRRPGARLESR